jgi:hypothetical protein
MVDMAYSFQIDSSKTLGQSARISSVISVLLNVNQTFQSFFEKEHFKNEELARVKEQNNKTLDSLKEDLELLIVELEHETYPYKPSNIAFENTVYILNKRLECLVEFEDEMYVIQNPELDITVWGNTREEVEYSFGFTFHSLYQNFALEQDERLSEEAKLLKTNLLNIVKKVIHES